MEQLKIRLVPSWDELRQAAQADGQSVPKITLISAFTGKHKARAEVLAVLQAGLGFESAKQLQAAQAAVQAGLFLELGRPGVAEQLQQAGMDALAAFARQVASA